MQLNREFDLNSKEPVSAAKPTNRRKSLSYLYGGATTSYLIDVKKTNNSLDTVSPDYFDVDTAGNLLISYDGKIDQQFIQQMHQQNIKVVPFISNHWNRAKGNAAINNREMLSKQIAEQIMAHDLDGVNIDIENVNEQYRLAYTDFTHVLRQKLPPSKEVSVAVAANPNNYTTGWHGSYDYSALAGYADYLMVMGYDESYLGGPAGPVSSSTFFEKSIQYALNNNVPKEKIVLGIPFFGRYWKQEEAVGGYGITSKDIAYLIDNYSATQRYDMASQSANAVVAIQPGDPKPTLWGGFTLSAGVYNIWYDNLLATKYKLKMIHDYDLLGAGSWALGQENPAVWDFYTAVLNSKTAL